MKIRNLIISLFVIFWTVLFHYESTREFFLEPIFDLKLPKTKFLFPPAGWIMFFHVDAGSGHAAVYGIKDNVPQMIDPHDILATRTICFDNIHRNVLTNVFSAQNKEPFCRFLKRKFGYFDDFLITGIYYPSVAKDHYLRLEKLVYACGE